MPVVGFPQSEAWSVAATMLAWVRSAPLGTPVVPPVNWIRAGSSGAKGTRGSRVSAFPAMSSEKWRHPSSRSSSLAVLTPNPVM